MTNKEIIEVVTAAERGEKIEVLTHGWHRQWNPAANPAWDFSHFDYRVALKPLECWVLEDGLKFPYRAYRSEQTARFMAQKNDPERIVHMREVLE